jgi:hypothetical protein
MKRAFHLANEQYRMGNYIDTLLIYDELSIKSLFNFYAESWDRCINNLTIYIGYSPQINSLKDTIITRLFRCVDNLIRLKYTDKYLIDTIKNN